MQEAAGSSPAGSTIPVLIEPPSKAPDFSKESGALVFSGAVSAILARTAAGLLRSLPAREKVMSSAISGVIWLPSSSSLAIQMALNSAWFMMRREVPPARR